MTTDFGRWTVIANPRRKVVQIIVFLNIIYGVPV